MKTLITYFIFLFVGNTLALSQYALFYVRESTDRLYRYELPSGPEVSISLSALGSSGNSDLVFDEVNQKLYWIMTNNGGNTPFLRSIPADFSASTSITTEFALNNVPASALAPLGSRGLSVDGANNKVYVGEAYFNASAKEVNELVSYDLSNANPVSTRTVLHSFMSSLDISSTVVDAANNRVYWAHLDTKIGYVDLNGNNPTILHTFSGLGLFTIRKDPLNERIIFTQTSTGPGMLGAISTASGTPTALYSTSPLNPGFANLRPLGILNNGDMYFVEYYSDAAFNFLNRMFKGNVNTSPGSNTVYNGITFSPTGDNLNFFAAGSLSSPEPAVSVAATTATTSENTGALVFQFTRTGGDVSATLQINFSITGNASNTDYNLSGHDSFNTSNNTGKITFSSNQSTVNLTVTPVNDLVVEGDETVTVTVAPPD